jgi:lysylphosphatidylglycerol synthetase-like protein (DUF2156 family)
MPFGPAAESSRNSWIFLLILSCVIIILSIPQVLSWFLGGMLLVFSFVKTLVKKLFNLSAICLFSTIKFPSSPVSGPYAADVVGLGLYIFGEFFTSNW